MRYEWKHRAGNLTGTISADDVGAELERIRALTGRLTPEAVVAEARPSSSPIHDAFEWDDAAAGEKYRVHQARNLIRAVRVVVADVDGGEVARPQFVHINRSREEHYYQDTELAVANVDEFVIALNGLERKVTGAERALDELRKLAGARGDKTVALLALASSSLSAARDAIQRIN